MNPLSKLRQVKANNGLVYEVWSVRYVTSFRKNSELISRHYVIAQEYLNHQQHYYATEALAIKQSRKQLKKNLVELIKITKGNVRSSLKSIKLYYKTLAKLSK